MITAGLLLMYLNRPRLTEQGGTRAPARGVAIAPEVSDHMLGIAVSITH